MCLGCNSRCCRRVSRGSGEVIGAVGEEVGVPVGNVGIWLQTLADKIEFVEAEIRKFTDFSAERIKRFLGSCENRVVDACITDVEPWDDELQLRDESRYSFGRPVVGQRCGTGETAEAVQSNGGTAAVAEASDGISEYMGAENDQCAGGCSGEEGQEHPDGVSALHETRVQVTSC